MKRYLILVLLTLFASTASAQTDIWGGKTATQGKTFLSLNNVENTALSTWAGSTNITTLGTISTGTWSATQIAVNKGGTGQTTYTDGQLLIGNSSGNTLTKSTLTGTSNQITITNGNGSITIATPQDIATASTPQFARLGLNQSADATASLSATQTALGTTRTDGIILKNTTAATGGATQQYSPSLVLQGAAWNSTGSASQTDKWDIHNEPQTVAGTTTANLVFGASINGGAYSTGATLKSDGTFNIANGATYQINGTNVLTGSALGSGVTSSSLTTVGTIGTGVWQGTKVAEAYGGTNQSTYATGDILYASGSNTLSKLTIGSTNYVLTVVGGVPSWQPASGGGLTYSVITADQTATVNNGYFTNKSGTRLVLTLPASPTVGQAVAVGGDPTNGLGWKLAQPASTKIYSGSNATTAGTGGYIQSASSDGTDYIQVVFMRNDGTNNLWLVVAQNGVVTIN